MTIETSTANLIGGRDENEDTLAVFRDDARRRITAVVCDGLGGHTAGKTASATATKAFMAHCREHADADPATRLRNALYAANDAVRAAVTKNPRLHGMGTTLLGVEADETDPEPPDGGGSEPEEAPAAQWISVGDSPLWSCQNGQMCGLVNEMHNLPGSKHTLTSAVMGQDEIEDIDQGSIEFPAGDTLIAASDGLDALKNGRLLHFARTTPTRRLADVLANEAVAAGGKRADNTAVVVIHRKGGD